MNIKAKLKVDYGKNQGTYYIFQIASTRTEAMKTIFYFEKKGIRVITRKVPNSKYLQLYKKNI